MITINPKWLGFMLFVWLFGLFIGATYEGSSKWEGIMQKDISGSDPQHPATAEILFSPNKYTYQGTSGEISWWAPSSPYWGCWLRVLIWDFPFCKDYDANENGVIDATEVGNNDFGKYAGYFLKAFGIVGLSAFLFAFFQFLQGIIPW